MEELRSIQVTGTNNKWFVVNNPNDDVLKLEFDNGQTMLMHKDWFEKLIKELEKDKFYQITLYKRLKLI